MREGSFLYFAYGSNMSSRRLRAADRAPSAVFVETARLEGHRLVFDKVGMDGSAKADCERTGRPHDEVHGALFRIDDLDRPALDRAEGRGDGYDAFELLFEAESGPVRALTYLATRKDPALLPFDWYVRHVRVGARECGLPDAYLAAIERVRTVVDPDLERQARELAR
jgi:gamma-glutamylcyclotransferase